MKSTPPFNSKILLFFLCVLFSSSLYAWGFYAHQKINRLAVFCMPSETFGFFKKHIDYLSEHAVDPDKRRYLVKGEGEKHYIDIDYYERALPFDTLPRSYLKAVNKYGKDTLHAYGIVPWNIQWALKSLTEAFATKNEKKILKFAAEIGHYIGDAHVPLHVTANYNGQLTNQHGIHGFLESRLPELFSTEYDFFVGPAHYIHNPLNDTWEIIESSFAALDSVFYYEKKLQELFPENSKYSYEVKGNQLQKVYSIAFSNQYHLFLDGLVERRMRMAVQCVASFWYTAWVNAGQPDLDILKKSELDSADIDFFPFQLPSKMLGRQEN